MTILKKDMVPIVTLGTPEIQAVVGHPARKAYWTVERREITGWIMVEGLTWQRVPLLSLADVAIRFTDPVTGKLITIWHGMDSVFTGTMWDVEYYLDGRPVKPGEVIATWGTVVEEIWTYHPAVPAVASVAYRPATPTTIEMSYNAGWNSYAVSIGKVEDGQFVEYDIPSGNSGVFVGLGPSSLYSQPLANFDYGVLADTQGVKIFERGKTVRSLTNNINTRYTVRIYRRGGRVTYSVLNGSAIVATYESAKPVSGSMTMIAHGYMYRGGDIIADAEILSTPVKLMPPGFKATLSGSAKLNVFNADAYLRGEASVTVAFNGAKLKGRSYLYEDISTRTGRIRGFLPPLTALFADSSFSGAISSTLPPMQVRLAEEYVPARRQTIDLTLPPLSFSGFMSRSRSGSIEGALPPVMMKGGTFPYGEISGTLAPLQAIFYEDPLPGMGFLFSSASVAAQLDGRVDYLFVFDSKGVLVDTYSFSRELAATIVEALEASGTFTVIGSFTVEFLSNIGCNEFAAATKIKAGGVEVAGVDPGARVWVVNTDTGATVQYDDYGFNSFFERDGEYFGVAEDGIYKLSGTTDAGVPIEGLVDYGTSTFGTAQRKRLMNVYAGVSSTNRMLLKVSVDGDTYIYEARSSESGHLKHHRFDLGRGLAGTHWRLQLLNKSGCDFDLESVEFEPVILSRKI